MSIEQQPVGRRGLLLALLLLWSSQIALLGQSYTISTVAGGGGPPVNVPGTSVTLGFEIPTVVAADAAGNIFFSVQNSVLRLDATTQMLTLVAGNGTSGSEGDNGPASSAQLSRPGGLAVDFGGNLYIADTDNNRIRRVTNGVITTVAGGGSSGLGDNGPATGAQLHAPVAVALDAAGILYIADLGNKRIRTVSNGIISTVAGNGTAGFSGDNGPATSAQLADPIGIGVDAAGGLYICEASENRIRRVSNGVITTVAGNGIPGFSGDNGPAAAAEMTLPSGIAVDSAGSLYIADTDNARVRKVTGGVITTVAGSGSSLGDNGPATSAQVGAPLAVAVDSAGNLYIAANSRIRKVSGGVITTVVGGGSQIGDRGPATSASLDGPSGVALDSAGDLYIADSLSRLVRKVSNGIISTVAGGGNSGTGDGGPATSAQLPDPVAVAVGPAGDLYIADSAAGRIRKVANGVITTVAGYGACCSGGDGGPATAARFNDSSAVAVDSDENLYIADTFNQRIRKVSGGLIMTVAGSGTLGYSGDNGPAVNAQLNVPLGVAVDSDGNLYIADSDNNCVRRVSNGVITTVAGNGMAGFSGDGGPAVQARLNYPLGVAVDSVGNLYVADASNNRVRRVSNGIITTIAGTGARGFSGDGGPATAAQLYGPSGIVAGPDGSVYVADSVNSRVRLLTPTPSINPGGVVNAASSAAGSPITPGSIATVFGSFLLSSLSQASGSPLPTNLGGLSLQFGGGLQAPLFAVSSGQVNFQVPWELAGQRQTALSATVNGQIGVPQVVNLAPFAPGIFAMSSQGTGQGAVLDSSYRLVDASNPATAGSTVIQVYCTGLGAVTNQPPTGSPAPGGPLAYTTAIPTVTVGGAQATVLFSGLAPGSVGEYQVDALVPAGSPKGASVPVVIAIGGSVSNTVTIAVQ